MELDQELVRTILLEIEKRPIGSNPASLDIAGYNEHLTDETMRELRNKGYLIGTQMAGRFWPEKLTPEGEKHLEKIRNPSFFGKTKWKISDFISNHSAEIIVAVISGLILFIIALLFR